MSLEWQTDPKTLIDGEAYLVDMKHGLHEGNWNEISRCFDGYLFSEHSFYGSKWILVSEVKK